MAITKQNYVLVDFENVQSVELEKIGMLPVKVVIFVGQNQRTIPLELFRKACAVPGLVEVVEAVGSGKNALDFQMACYAGRIAEREPEAFIHFLSKDKGFDVVVQYLKSAKRFAARADDFSSLRFLAQNDDYKSFTLPQKVDHVLALLQRIPAATRPRKIKTLLSSMNAMFSRQLDEPTLNEILEHLITSGKIQRGEKDAVTYGV